MVCALFEIALIGRLHIRWLSAQLARRAVLTRLFNEGRFDVRDLRQLSEAFAWLTDGALRDKQLISMLAEMSTSLRLHKGGEDGLLTLRGAERSGW